MCSGATGTVPRSLEGVGHAAEKQDAEAAVKAKLREDRAEAVGPNDVWAMDFVHDQLATGRKIRVLTVVDTFSRYAPALDTRFSYRGEASSPRWNGSVREPAIRRRYALIRAPSSSRATWTFGLTSAASRSTSRGRASPPQRLHRSVQCLAAGGMFERSLVLEPCGCGGKVGGLAQRL